MSHPYAPGNLRCPLCRSSFRSSRLFRRHLRYDHDVRPELPAPPPPTEPAPAELDVGDSADLPAPPPVSVDFGDDQPQSAGQCGSVARAPTPPTAVVLEIPPCTPASNDPALECARPFDVVASVIRAPSTSTIVIPFQLLPIIDLSSIPVPDPADVCRFPFCPPENT